MLEIKRYATSVGKLTGVLVGRVLCSFHDPHPHSLPKGSTVSSAVSGGKKLAGVELVGSKGLFSKSRSRL